MKRLFPKSRDATTGIFNVGFRTAAAASKFFLMFALAKWLPPAELGVFGLVSAALLAALIFVGGEYHVFNTREILKDESPSRRLALIYEQFIVYAAAYVCALPAVLLSVKIGLLPREITFWFIPILIAEHLSIEGYRLLITLSRSRLANIVFFLRSGFWPFLVITVMWLAPSTRRISILWPAWFLCAMLAFGLCVWFLRDIFRHRLEPVRLSRILTGFKIAAPFMAASLCIRGIFASDRYFIETFRTTDEVGVYTLFFGIAYFVHIAVEASVFTVQFPGLVAAYQCGDIASAAMLRRRFARSVLLVTAAVSACAAVGIHPVVLLIGKSIYMKHLAAFYIVLLAIVTEVIGMIFYFRLYAENRDRVIVVAYILGLLTALACNRVAVPALGITGAALSTWLACIVVLLGKWLGVRYSCASERNCRR